MPARGPRFSSCRLSLRLPRSAGSRRRSYRAIRYFALVTNSSVYVVENGKITQQSVTLGVRQGNLWEIVDGLKGTETLASTNLNLLATGTPVREETGAGSAGATARSGRPDEGGRR